ncbi:MAG TPA: phenylalanine--tRNA ligase subunit beta [Terriglobia bacterium]|nr:phenylalanine--tRNA ligase subunit beta [Terriglobia bacterium]
MKVLLNWLSEFVELPPDRRELETRLTMLGLGVASSTPIGGDRVLDLEVTTNRPDCLGHLGVAREAAAGFVKPLRLQTIAVTESNRPAHTAISIEIDDVGGCARFCGRVIQNVKVQPSPEWLARRLEAVGVRPINNVADVTNYVLMELGHPMHAYDLDRLAGSKIIVRRARAGEKVHTLDGVKRTLSAEDLVIADAERAVGLAGVMGGEDSEIAFRTRAVMLESAWFEPVGIRRASKRHGLHTEASHRFERGADIEMARQAIDRAAALIAELAGGDLLMGVVDAYPEPRTRAAIGLRASEILRILGAAIGAEEVAASLNALGFQVEPHGEGFWRVTPPSFRLDVAREIDLVEEVARLHGYDRLPSRVRPAPPFVDRDARREKEMTISSTLVALGYREIIVSSMVDPEENARFTDEEPVRLVNPLIEDASAMRSTSAPGMLRALRWNLDRGQTDLRLFEFGEVYTTSTRTAEGLPAERRVLTLGATGFRRPGSVHDAARALDFFDLKGDLEVALRQFDLKGLEFKTEGSRYHESGVAARFIAGDQTLARFGQVSHEVAREYKLRQPVYLAEIDLEKLLAAPLRGRAFRPFSKFPAVERDLSLVLPGSVRYSDIESALGGSRIEGLQEFHPADRFEGGTLPAGHYSLLLRIVLQSTERTLTGEEADRAAATVVEALEPLGVHLRTA